MQFDKAVSFADFHVYTNQTITELTENEVKGIKNWMNKGFKTLLLADDQVVVADSEDALQITI
jgi:hypothetical protein